MCIIGYDVIKIKVSKAGTWYDAKKNILYSRELPTGYKYFVELQKFNPDIQDYDRFIAFGNTKFHNECRRLDYDDFGRYKICPIGHKHYFQYSDRTNFVFTNVEANDDYDVYSIE